jgi:methylmalonyl-CoA/ethylmalonyl-CoA epimerase
MNKYGLQFHHLGLAVAKKAKALKFLRGLGYEIGDEIYDPIQKVNLLMCSSSGLPQIEIIMPAEKQGLLDNILKGRTELIYHTCYITNDLNSSIEAIRNDQNRIVPVAGRAPAILFGDKYVSFYLIDGFGLIEILEERKVQTMEESNDG